MNTKKKIFVLLLMAFVLKASAANPLDKYIDRMKYYRYSKHLDSTKFYFKKALPLALQLKDSAKIFYTYKYMADGFEHHQKLDSTLLMYSKGKRFIPKNNYARQAFLLCDMAYTYDLLYDYEKSTQLTLIAEKLAEKSGDQAQIGSIAISIAEGFSNLKMNKQAELYYEKSIKIGKANKLNDLLDQAYRYYGMHLLNNRKLDAAFKNLKLGYTSAVIKNDSISMAYSWRYMSDYYWYKKQIDSSFILAKKAEKIWENRAENRDLSEVCLQQGSYYLELGQWNNAEKYLKKAEKYVLEDLYFNEKLYGKLADLYFKKKDLKLAFEYLAKSKKCLEQINENENKSRVTNLRLKFESDKKEALIQKTLKDKALATENTRKKTELVEAVSVTLFFVIISLAVIVFSYLKIKTNNTLLKKSNESLELLAHQKRILLKEIHHRVKNNLTTLKSLLFLQARSSTNSETKAALEECQIRIESMALIHQNLYDENESDILNFNRFIEQLFESISQSYATNNKAIEIELIKNDYIINVSLAIPLGIILNELVTNSFKYAFLDQDMGKINLTLTQKNDTLIISYYDNGIGLRDNFNSEFDGFGFKLIKILAEQINAIIEYQYTDNKSLFTIYIHEIQ
jgi:two-component sensor histidine kinase